MPISFKNIPSTLRTPLFFAEVDPTNSNTSPQTYVGLLVGQLLPTGTNVVTVPTSAPTASGTTLTFASAGALAGIVPGPYVFAIDRTTPTAIPALTSVLSISGTTVTLSGTVTGVLSGDSIQFVNLVPQWMTSQTSAAGLYGQGSQIARMNAARLQADSFGEWWAQPLPDDLESVKATGTLTFTGAPTANAAVLALYVAGVSVPVVLTLGMSPTVMATAVAAAINAAVDPIIGILPVSATSSAGVVTLTALNAGACGNDLNVQINYYGPANNEFTPAGINVSISPMSGGATNPSVWMAGLLAMLPPTSWSSIAFPYNDTTSLNDMQSFMNDITGEWAWSSMKYGCAFTVLSASAGTLQTDGVARNDQHTTIMGVYQSPTPPDQWAATIAGAALAAQRAQPGCSLNQTLLPGILPPAPSNRFGLAIQNTLLWSGISTYTVDQGGNVYIQKLITTYQVNSFGDPDDSYLEVETMFRIAYALLYMKSNVETQFSGALLADDGTRFAPGIKVATPSLIAAYLCGLYANLINLAICQDLAAFQAALIVERNTTNRNRVDVLWPGILVDDLDIVALLAQPTNPLFT